jgi:hypothetical protein
MPLLHENLVARVCLQSQSLYNIRLLLSKSIGCEMMLDECTFLQQLEVGLEGLAPALKGRLGQLFFEVG